MTFTVEVQEDGSAASGKTVTFSITSGDGNASLGTTSITTGSNGRAQTTLTLGGSASGSYTITATVGSKSTSGTATVVTSEASPPPSPPPLRTLVMSHSPWPLDAGESMTFTVEIQEDGSAAPGKTVTFSVSPDDGTVSLSATSVTTDSNGQAQTILRTGSGSSGSYTVTASVGISSVGTTIEVVDTEISEQQQQQPSPPSPMPRAFAILLDDYQTGLPGKALANPFVVEVRNQNGDPLEGVAVRFAVTAGGGTLSATTPMTDANGQAESTLTLGDEPGTNTVEASAEGISQTAAFNVEASLPPPVATSLTIVLGGNQTGLTGEALVNPFVIEVRDQYDDPMAGVTVTFGVLTGGGSLSHTSVDTDADGLAQTTLTLGSEPGTNTVEASAEGISQSTVFNVEASLPPPVATSLTIVLGDNQTDLTGEALVNPFVIEVRDQYDDPMAGVTVTFGVLTGGGSLSAATATTDANGRAESTLTLGSGTGTNTVEVSVEGITEAAIFNAVAELLQFDLTVPSGTSLIHVPLKVRTVDGAARTIESIADLYDALGGADTVKFLITHNRDTHQWNSYLGDESAGGAADAAIGDDTGLIAVMKSAATLELMGDALGTSGDSQINISPGNNLVGVPLDPENISMISDLLVEGVGAIAVSNAARDGFHTITAAGQDGDGPIIGGVGYIVVATAAANIPIVGSAWENSGAAMAAPPMVTGDFHAPETTPVLALSGSIVDGVKGINRNNLHVIAKNLSTGSAVTTTIEETSGTSSPVAYQVTIVDLKRGRAAAIGDILEISAISPDESIAVQPLRYTVTVEDVKSHRIQLPELIVQEIPMETQLLPNYPNPFNPETWIPYHLTSDAEVQLTIYDTKGVSVRHIGFGASGGVGYYTNQTKAAYWDGRNENGESVASGVYFYQLQAGGVSATRKMVILK